MRSPRSARRERQDINRLVRQIEATGHSGGRTSAVRVFVLQYFRAAASEAGHEAANHGGKNESVRATPRTGLRLPRRSVGPV